MRSFAIIKPRSWQCEKDMSTKTTWWLWKVIYAWIREYFRILCKSIGYIQSNKEIWGEDRRYMCGREDPTLVAKEVPLCGGRDRGVAKYGFSFNTRSHEKIISRWRKSQWDSRARRCTNTFFKVRWFWIFPIRKRDLKEEAETALTDQTIDQMKGTDWPVQLAITIWDPNLTAGLTNQKLNAIIIKTQIIMLGIAGVEPKGLRRMQILW